MLGCWWWKSVDPLLALHASSIGLADLPRAWCQVQCVCGNEVFALRRHPVGALAWWHVHDVHCVDLFETASAGLAEEEVDDNRAEEVAGCKNVAVAVVDSSGDERSEERNQEVLQVVSEILKFGGSSCNLPKSSWRQ